MESLPCTEAQTIDCLPRFDFHSCVAFIFDFVSFRTPDSMLLVCLLLTYLMSCRYLIACTYCISNKDCDMIHRKGVLRAGGGRLLTHKVWGIGQRSLLPTSPRDSRCKVSLSDFHDKCNPSLLKLELLHIILSPL